MIKDWHEKTCDVCYQRVATIDVETCGKMEKWCKECHTKEIGSDWGPVMAGVVRRKK